MEAEERPSKLQKTDHTPDQSIAKFAESFHEATVKQNVSEGNSQNESLLDNAGVADTEKVGSVQGIGPSLTTNSASVGSPQPEEAEKEDAVHVNADDTPIEPAHDSEHPSSLNVVAEGVQLSKNQRKKLERERRWEEGRAERKRLQKEKDKQRKERKKAEREAQKEAQAAEGITNTRDAAGVGQGQRGRPVQLPVTVIIDCSYDELMTDVEVKSLAVQIARCYSQNKAAQYKVHLVVSSFGGRLKEHLHFHSGGSYTNWKGVRFLSEDFSQASEKAKDWMTARNGGRLEGALKPLEGQASREAQIEGSEVIYLSSDSADTLSALKPYSTYILGGLVDKNRHKGICYKRAMEKDVKTARLPVAEYLDMSSRKVLTTNHVAELMYKWLDYGDWARAFMDILPMRKGGKLRQSEKSSGTDGAEVEEEVEQQDEVEDHAIDGGRGIGQEVEERTLDAAMEGSS